MTYSLGTIREWKTPNFRVIVDAIEDDSGIDDLHSEPDAQAEIMANLDSGKWILFCARARVFCNGAEIASDYLGGCIYESLEAFADHIACGKQNREYREQGKPNYTCGSYFAGMVNEVCKQARLALLEQQKIRVRQ